MKCAFLELVRKGDCSHLSESRGPHSPARESGPEGETPSHLLHAQQALLELSSLCLLLLHSVLCSLKGHSTLFCFSLALAECDLRQDRDG